LVLALVEIYDQAHPGLSVALRTKRSGKYHRRTWPDSYVVVSRVDLKHVCH